MGNDPLCKVIDSKTADVDRGAAQQNLFSLSGGLLRELYPDFYSENLAFVDDGWQMNLSRFNSDSTFFEQLMTGRGSLLRRSLITNLAQALADGFDSEDAAELMYSTAEFLERDGFSQQRIFQLFKDNL